MCFRPPSAEKGINCPNCGALNPMMASKCLKCKTDLSSVKQKEIDEKAKD